jgi:type III restriction enzyme
MPYVCLRIPTGGGKTLVAAHAIGDAAVVHLQVTNPMVLWLVPSTPIRDQTLAALKDRAHPYRAALAADFGENVSVMTVQEAQSISRPDALGNACIIVATIQAFRREETEGLKVYADNGALMSQFGEAAERRVDRLEKIEGTNRPVRSLENFLRLHRPMVIVDQAHNARTPLSFQMLSRFYPSMVLELTATPELENNPEREKHPPNILHHISAAELKVAEMIKLPIRLQTDPGLAPGHRLGPRLSGRVGEAALAEEQETGEYIRPIVLFVRRQRSWDRSG